MWWFLNFISIMIGQSGSNFVRHPKCRDFRLENAKQAKTNSPKTPNQQESDCCGGSLVFQQRNNYRRNQPQPYNYSKSNSLLYTHKHTLCRNILFLFHVNDPQIPPLPRSSLTHNRLTILIRIFLSLSQFYDDNLMDYFFYS